MNQTELLTRFQVQRNHVKECLNKGVDMLAEGWLTLYQIWVEKTYKAEHETWEDFLADFSHDVKDASRTLMFDRVRMVRRLKDIGWLDEQILEALKSPTVMQEALIRLAEWERGGGLKKLANGVKRPENMEEDASDREVLDHLLTTAVDLSRGEGRKYVSESVDADQIYASLRRSDGHTAIIIIDEDVDVRYAFFCREEVSDRAKNFLERAFRTRFED